MNQDKFEYCLVDADSIIHAVANIEPSLEKGKKFFDNQVRQIITQNGGNGIVFIKGIINFRTSYPTYKFQRNEKQDPAVKQRIVDLYEYAGTYCTKSEGGEADDYVTFTAKECENSGYSYVVSHIDKDLNCIPGWHHNFRKNEYYEVTPEEGYRFLMRQLLQGDRTDSIGGIPGMGPVGAAKALDSVPIENVFSTVMDIWFDRIGAKWKPAFEECANLIYMREYEEDIRILNLEELKERFTWKPRTVTGSPSPNDQPEPSDSSTQFSDQPEDNT